MIVTRCPMVSISELKAWSWRDMQIFVYLNYTVKVLYNHDFKLNSDGAFLNCPINMFMSESREGSFFFESFISMGFASLPY